MLGVEILVTGDVRRLGGKFIISVRLINDADESQLRGNQYAKTSAEIIAAQNEIAQAVAQNLRPKLSPAEQQKIEKRPTENAEAYQLHLQGLYHWNNQTTPEIKTGIVSFQKAVELEPNCWLEHLFLARIYLEKQACPEAVALPICALARSGRGDEALGHPHTTGKSPGRALRPALMPGTRLSHGLGETGQTYELLEQALQQQDVRLVFLKVEPKWNDLRSDPRFQNILHRVGF